MLAVSGRVLAAEVVARSNPDLQLIVDHLGIAQPHGAQELAGDPFARLDELLSLAQYPNVAVKVSRVPTLSREAYPYADMWPHLHKVLDAFGPEHVMWGSDFSRTRPLAHVFRSTRLLAAYGRDLSRGEGAVAGYCARRVRLVPATFPRRG